MIKVLTAVEKLGLPDCWVAAGFVRNPVWDALHGFPWSASYTDIDVVYFDPLNIDPKHDDVIEAELAVAIPAMTAILIKSSRSRTTILGASTSTLRRGSAAS
jgi:hypothetical protein